MKTSLISFFSPAQLRVASAVFSNLATALLLALLTTHTVLIFTLTLLIALFILKVTVLIEEILEVDES